MTDEEKIKEWENKNSFLASILQKECLNYLHYKQEILESVEMERLEQIKNDVKNYFNGCINLSGYSEKQTQIINTYSNEYRELISDNVNDFDTIINDCVNEVFEMD